MFWIKTFTTFLIFLTLSTIEVSADQSCQLATPQWSEMKFQKIKLRLETGEEISLRSRLADDSAKRAAGFQHICSEIIELNSILFVYEKPTISNFHMNNVHAELDIAFFDKNKELISVMRMRPAKQGESESALYSSGSEIQYALEMPAGLLFEHNLNSGKTVLVFD